MYKMSLFLNELHNIPHLLHGDQSFVHRSLLQQAAVILPLCRIRKLLVCKQVHIQS